MTYKLYSDLVQVRIAGHDGSGKSRAPAGYKRLRYRDLTRKIVPILLTQVITTVAIPSGANATEPEVSAEIHNRSGSRRFEFSVPHEERSRFSREQLKQLPVRKYEFKSI